MSLTTRSSLARVASDRDWNRSMDKFVADAEQQYNLIRKIDEEFQNPVVLDKSELSENISSDHRRRDSRRTSQTNNVLKRSGSVDPPPVRIGDSSDSFHEKLDALDRKFRAQDLAIQKVLQNQKVVAEIVQKFDRQIQADGNRREAKLMGALQEGLAELKSFVMNRNQPQSSESGVQTPAVSMTLSDRDKDILSDVVEARVKNVITKSVERVAAELSTEHSRLTSRVSTLLEKDKRDVEELRGGLLGFEKELNRMRADIVRSKSRSDAFEENIKVLAAGAAGNERTQEELHRRLLSSCRDETQRLVESAVRKINEALAESQESSGEQLRRAKDDSRRAQSGLKDLLAWRDHINEQNALSEQVVVKLFAEMKQLQEQHASINSLVTDMAEVQISAKSDKNFPTGQLPETRFGLDHITPAISSHSIPQDLVNGFEVKFNTIIGDMSTLTQICQEQNDTIGQLRTSDKKTREKVRGLLESTCEIGQMRQSLEKIIQFLQSMPAEQQSHVESLDARLKALEVSIKSSEVYANVPKTFSNNFSDAEFEGISAADTISMSTTIKKNHPAVIDFCANTNHQEPGLLTESVGGEEFTSSASAEQSSKIKPLESFFDLLQVKKQQHRKHFKNSLIE